MRVSRTYKIPLLATVVLLAACLTGCPTPPRVPPPSSGQNAPVLPRLPGHEGRPYDIASADSLLTIQAFRGGALAKAGHNHVIASHTLTGTLYVPVDPGHATFEVHMPVADLTVDEAVLRAKENSEEFPPDIPDSAKEGTRKNMLSAALLDGEHYPEILLRSERLEPVAGGDGSQWIAHVQVTVRDRTSPVVVPVHYESQDDQIIVSGEFPLKQSDLGLTPFSALLGALQVVDEMKVRFRIVARAATTQAGH
jgi:polyisoprenoid-binding protein YceI